MAQLTFTDAYVSVNSVDLSDHVKSVTLSYSAPPTDGTAMGNSTKINAEGVKEWSVSIDLHQDYAASSVDATLFSLVGTTTAVVVRPVKTGGVSSTNPNWTGTGYVESYTPVGGAHGERLGTSVSILSAGTLSRATS
jgi:hypothetical protein